MGTSATSKSRRIDLILRQIDSLPTLPVVATKLLSMTSNDESHARDVIKLVSSDPALTSKILAICRAANQGVRSDVLTVERAVVLLGFNAVRNAVLSTKIFEVFGVGETRPREDIDEESDAPAAVFNRVEFWRHSLAVAITAEKLAAGHPGHTDMAPAEAFVCGLLHDVGKLALDYVLPKSFARVIELAELNQGNIAEFERRIIGIDHHTAGKRLSELWQLPHRLQDCIWLHGSPYASLPKLEHRSMIGLVTLADMLVRRAHIGYSGNFVLHDDCDDLVAALNLKPQVVERVMTEIHDELHTRCESLGLDETPSRELFLQSIKRANEALGALNNVLERRSHVAARQAQVLEAITNFNATATPGQSVDGVLNEVAASASAVLGEGFYAVLHQPEVEAGEDRIWLVMQFDRKGAPVRSDVIEPPANLPDIQQLDVNEPVSMELMGLLPWVADSLVDAPDLRKVRLLPLRSGWGTAAVILHSQETLPPAAQLASLTSTWGTAIAAAGKHEGARRLGEDLARANRELAEAQDKLLHSESMARLGEMAAGAAHEMNNPLAVISGRAELLRMTLPRDTREHAAADKIFQQAHRLSDLITALRMFADPPSATCVETDVRSLLEQAVADFRATFDNDDERPAISLEIDDELPTVRIDPQQVAQVITDLLSNAVQAQPRTGVVLSAKLNGYERKLLLRVMDDGIGMDERTLEHAMDPFFSAKSAGRRVGMGLTRAQQLVAGHGGDIELRSSPDSGTTATLAIPLDSN